MSSGKIPYGKQEILEEDISAVVDVLKGDFLTQGPKISDFEEKFKSYIGSKYAVAVSNGTAALHLSILALGIKKGQKVITSPLTFVATSNAILYAGGVVDFCDINPDTLQLDLSKVQDKIAYAEPGTYAGIIPVDFAGLPVAMDGFKSLAEQHGLWVLEDACHAPGGYYFNDEGKKQKAGDCAYADCAIFSFHPVKHIACGEGGMITTNNENTYRKLLQLRSHGITKEAKELQKNEGGWYYEMHTLGYNYRLTDISCALGISQLNRAQQNIEKRRSLAKNYEAALNQIEGIELFPFQDGHAYHLYVIKVDHRKALYDYLKKHNIFAQIHYIPVHTQPYYQKMGWQKGDFPIVESYYQKCLTLPLYPNLKPQEQAFIIETIRSFQTLIS